ncbi:MAG TPA: gephyrin-like molybdotransferase Glp [Verrucomicrobiae bacterium]|jgi:molybdopterin molybdotransferase|nr:gephyrin-like molybdotransferase Glp [Verrucomicrobiae bacterium]
MIGPPASGVVPFDQACETVSRYCGPVRDCAAEECLVLQALGRILAEPILADRDFPPFPRATRDGYALRADAIRIVPATLRVTGQVKAGSSFHGAITSGEAVEIMTGAPVPHGADAVVMVEYTSRAADQVVVQRTCVAGENIVSAGSEARAGQEMVPRGLRLGPAHIAVAAAVGKTTIKVCKQPRVAILSTGDEIVEASQTPGPFQIRNSNSYSLAAQVIAAGGEPVQLPVAPDEESKLTALVQQGLMSDLLLLSGGVSMGKFDLVEQVLASLGAEFFFTGALIQPGRPVVFGQVARSPGQFVPFFGLPGNPVSTLVTFDLFARPVVESLSGAIPERRTAAKARLGKEIKTKTGLTRFLPAMLRGGVYDPEVEVISWQGSGDLMASARANCYVVIPPDRESLPAGEMVSILLR